MRRSNACILNPGAAGKHGWHKVRTLIRFVIDGSDMRDCEIVELGGLADYGLGGFWYD